MGQPDDARFAALCMELARLIQDTAIMERDLDWLLHRCQEVEAEAKRAENRYQEVAAVEQKKHALNGVKQPPSLPVQEVLKVNGRAPLDLLS